MGVKLDCDTALGLKGLSVGPTKEYFEGLSYRKGGSTPIAINSSEISTGNARYVLCEQKYVHSNNILHLILNKVFAGRSGALKPTCQVWPS